MQQSPGQTPMQYGLSVNNAPLPVILNTQPQSRVKDKYKVKIVKILSIIQIILGSSAIVFQIWDIINHSEASVVGAGIWTGVLFIIAGSLGVLSSSTRTTCAIVSFLVMSIVASVLTIALLVCSAISVGLANNRRERINNELENSDQNRQWYPGSTLPYRLQEPYLDSEKEMLNMVVAISAILVLISLTEAVVAIVSSCYACHGLCCSKSPQTNVLIQGQVQYIPGPNGQSQMVIVPMLNQANVMTANQPYQLTTPVGGYQTQPLAAPQGQIPTGIPQLHPAQASGTPQPPAYCRQTTPPPEYEAKEKQLLEETHA